MNKNVIQAIIEMPKGDTRRRHMKYDKSGFIELGLIKDVIPVNDGIMPVHYGYIPETLNERESDEVDVLIFSEKETKVGEKIDVQPIALIQREDGDDKVVAVDDSMKELHVWNDIPESVRKVIVDFFGYHSKIVSIEDAGDAIYYVKNGRKQYLKNSKSY